MLVTVAHEVVIARSRQGPGVMRIMNDEYPSVIERDGSVLPVILNVVFGRLSKPAQAEEVAGKLAGGGLRVAVQ